MGMIMWSDRDDEDDELQYVEQPGSVRMFVTFIVIALVLIAFGAVLGFAYWYSFHASR